MGKGVLTKTDFEISPMDGGLSLCVGSSILKETSHTGDLRLTHRGSNTTTLGVKVYLPLERTDQETVSVVELVTECEVSFLIQEKFIYFDSLEPDE